MMTVGQLIESLKRLPQDTEVVHKMMHFDPSLRADVQKTVEISFVYLDHQTVVLE